MSKHTDVKVGKSGHYWTRCSIFPNGDRQYKLCLSLIIDEHTAMLIGNKQYDPLWKPIPEKKGWYFKNEKIKNLEFFNFP